jgi:hypothetical protein
MVWAQIQAQESEVDEMNQKLAGRQAELAKYNTVLEKVPTASLLSPTLMKIERTENPPITHERNSTHSI